MTIKVNKKSNILLKYPDSWIKQLLKKGSYIVHRIPTGEGEDPTLAFPEWKYY